MEASKADRIFGNIYKIIEPAEHLRDYVKDYMLLHFVSDKNLPKPVKPFPANTDHCLVFYIRGSLNSFDLSLNQYELFPKIAVNGSQISPFDFHLPNEFLMFSINFQPGAISKFIKATLLDFTNKRIDAEAVLGCEVRQAYEQMTTANTYHQIVQIAEKYLWDRIRKIKFHYQPLDQAGKIILQNHTDFNLAKMADMACLSIRQFERRFEQNFGITPKFYSRINRFYYAFRIKDRNPKIDWLTVAIHSGYHDYQHLVKDFKQFAGGSPNSLIEAQSRAPERLLRFD